MNADPRYRPPRSPDWHPMEEPFHWWGSVWHPPQPRTLPELVADHTLDADVAAAIAMLLARRASVVVVAGPSGAGKTTLLTALLDSYPAGTRRLHTRGCYEPFDVLTDDRIVPERSVLLANEISPHLPSYLWGPAVARFLAAREQGFALAATAHATTLLEFVHLLTAYPLRIPDRLVAAFDLVVVLDTQTQASGQSERRVVAVWSLSQAESGGITAVPLINDQPGDDVPDGDGRGHSVRKLDLDAFLAVAARFGYPNPASIRQALNRRTAALFKSTPTAT